MRNETASPTAWHSMPRINVTDIRYGWVESHVEDRLALARNYHSTCMSIDESLRYLTAKAFFDKLIGLPEDIANDEP